MKTEEFGNGAIREDKTGKGRFDLIPWCAVMRIAHHMEESLKVYSPRNWEKGLPMHSMIDSAFRHLAKYMDGQTDEDHLCAATTNLLMAMWTEEKMPNMQDIPSRRPPVPTEDTEDVEGGCQHPQTTACKERQEKDHPVHGSDVGICRFCKYGPNLFGGCGGHVCTGTREMDPCPFNDSYIKCAK